jgi:hypothetical protein
VAGIFKQVFEISASNVSGRIQFVDRSVESLPEDAVVHVRMLSPFDSLDIFN